MEENLKDLENKIRSKANTKINKNTNNLQLDLAPTDNRQSYYGYSNDTYDMKYATLNNGEIINRYDSYLPGADNAELAAQNQSTFDKWTNGLTKAGANLLTTVAGNTVGFVVGAAEGASQGSWNVVFDNNFSNMLADYNDKLNYQLPNYVSKDEQDDNFLQSMGTANFWAKDVAGGLSFTLGTIVSEAIWAYATGGIANSAKWGLEGAKIANKVRWGKAALGAEEAAVGLANTKKFLAGGLENLYRVEQGAKIGATTAKYLNTARFLATSSGNEAGIEALQYKREQTENFYRDFEKLNGRNPNEDDISKFNEDLENSANIVFATNMAILAPSNMAMFGSLFNIESPVKGISKAMNKSLFGIGVEKTFNEAGELAYKGLKATGKQKIAQYTYAALKPLVTEGLWEEGLQGVTTKAAENWITSTYDPKYNNKTIALSDATYKAFADQYGTKAGWKEIGIGAIIGAGSSMVIGGGKFEEVREFEKAQDYQDEYVAKGLNEFGDNSALATDSIVKKIMLNARITNAVERQKEAIDKGDDVTAALAQQDSLIAEIQFRKSMGENTKELVSKYTTALQALPKEVFEEKGIEDIDGYKQTVIDSYKDLVNSYEKASDFADAVLGDTKVLGQKVSTQHLKEALTYSIVSGQKANKAMDGLLQDMGKIIGDDSVKTMQIQTELQRMGKNKQQQVRTVNNSISQTEQEVETLSNELQKLQVSKDEEKGARLQKVQEKLTNADKKLAVLKIEREELAKQVSQESKRRRNITGTKISDVSLATEFISGNDLADIDNKLQKIEDSIKSYEGVNHETYYDLLDLKRQYVTAKENFFSFQNSVDTIIRGDFAPKFSKVNGLLGRVFEGKDKPIDNFTNKFLEETFKNYTNSVGRSAKNTLTEDIISDEDYNTFKESGEVSQEVLNKLAENVKIKEELTEREKEIYSARTQEINALTKPNPNKPDLTRDVEKVEPLTEQQQLKQDIEQAFKKDYPMLTQDVDEMIKEKPTEQEIIRYQELYKKQAIFTEEEKKEFEELQPRMQKWFMAQSLPVGEATIADLVEILSQLETTLDRNDTLTEISSDDIAGETPQSKDASSMQRQYILQNMSGNAVTRIVMTDENKKEGDIFFYHIEVKTIIDKLLPNVGIATIRTVNDKNKLTKSQDLTPKLLEENGKKEGTVFTIAETKIIIGKRGSVVMSLNDYNKTRDIINLYYFNSNSGKWSYSDLYERLDDGTYRKKASDFKSNTISDNIYDAETGDSLNLFVDMKTDWNMGLVKDIFNTKGELPKELKNKIQNTLEITSRKGNDNNSTLKAAYEGATDDNFIYLRKKYFDKFLEIVNKEKNSQIVQDKIDFEKLLQYLPSKIDLEAEVSVKDMFLGTPNFQLDEALRPKELAITERGVEKVITQGYVQGSEMILGDKTLDSEDISRLYVTNLVKANPELKIPVVILEKGEYKFAFPISMIKTSEDKSSQLEAILVATETPIEVIKLVNNLMISLGLNTRITKVTPEVIDGIRAELANYSTFKTADELADIKYDKKQLLVDATIKVDMENEVISSPKLTVDYSTLTIGKLESNETDASKLREDIVKDMKQIEKLINSSVEIPDKNRFIEAFDNNVVENKGSDIMNRKDVNFIKEVFFTAEGGLKPIQGKAMEIIGKERLSNLRDKLQTLQFYEKQISTIKDKQTEKNLNCK